jgi:hypothetical protein
MRWCAVLLVACSPYVLLQQDGHDLCWSLGSWGCDLWLKARHVMR